jgi:ubiquinone/menaquinone biosynthesis C-methylase UbiE
VKNENGASPVQQYYQQSDQELAQRYITDQAFLSREYCEAALEHRYALYPCIHEFAQFESWAGKRVLEVGCGQGADLSQFAQAGAIAYGCDLTEKHCQITRDFLAAMDSCARVTQANAERLPFPDASFDLVYSFGVLLLVPNLDAAIAEIHRVLKPGGTVVTMFYNRESVHYYVKTLCYYGVVCEMEQQLGPRRLVDWFTDGFGYPRTYHQTPDSLRAAFSRFTIDRLAARHLTPDQLPLFPFAEYPAEFWEWLASRLGFYLMLTAHK